MSNRTSRSARDRAVRQIAAEMQRDANNLASVLFERHGRRVAAAHPRMRSTTLVRIFERAWLSAVNK